MLIVTLICLFVDIVSKLIVSNLLEVTESIRVIDNFFYLTYVRNTGAAWSIFSDNTWLVLIVSGLIILGIILYIYKDRPQDKFEKVSYGLVLGGAIGNFIDRIVYGYVIDFFDFYIFGYDYPIFNMADIFIVLGVIMLIVCTWRCKNE